MHRKSVFIALSAAAVSVWILLAGAASVPAASLKLQNGQSLDIRDFQKQGGTVRLTTSEGVTLSVPMSTVTPPAARWVEESIVEEQAGRFAEALQLIRFAARWDSSLPTAEREKTILERYRAQLTSQFLTSFQSQNVEATKAAYAKLAELGPPLPEAVAQALETLARAADEAAKKGDSEKARQLLAFHRAIRPEASGTAAAPVEAKLRALDLDQQIAQVQSLVVAGRVAEAQPLLDALSKEHPNDERVKTLVSELQKKTREQQQAEEVRAIGPLIDQGRWRPAEFRLRAYFERWPGDAQGMALYQRFVAGRDAFLAAVRKQSSVVCLDSPDETYYLYLPPKYDPARPTPILFLFGPNGAPDYSLIDPILETTNELGWIVAHPVNSKNGPWDAIWKAQDAVLRDVDIRLNLHPTRQFATGFSGGSRASFMLAFRYPKRVHGVLGMGGGLPGINETPAPGLAAYLIIGERDENIIHDIPRSEQVLRAAGAIVVRRSFPGEHQPPRKTLMRDGLLWLNQTVRE